MIITAKNTNITVAPRKLQLMIRAIKDLKPKDAVEQLSYLNYSSADPLLKTVKQAIANAVNNYNVAEDSLKFSEIFVGKGITFRRGHPGPKGRFKPFVRVRSNLTVKLIAPDAPLVAKKAPVKAAKPEAKAAPKKAAVKKTAKKITKKENSTKGRSASGGK